jgi:type I restriction enzyme S subunit
MSDTTDAMHSYADYRSSGDDWLGDIPAHWRSTSLGALSSRKSLRNRPDLPLLSVLREKGVILRSSLSQDENHNFIPDDLSNYQVASEGDLVVNKMKAWQGSVGIAPQDGIVSPAYYIFDLAEIKKKYAHRLLRSRLYADFFGRASDGVRIGQWDLGIPAMKRIPVVIPPPDEQDAIASYLDGMDRRIARFIRNRRRLIEVLNEQKQAIINRAVTRGLDPIAPLKPSGIDWLGDIPEHWEIKPLKYLSRRIQNGATPPTVVEAYYKDGVIPWFGPSSIGFQRYTDKPVKYLANRAFEDGKARMIYGPAILIVVIGATAGRMALLSDKGATNQQITAYELKSGVAEPHWVLDQLRLAESFLRSTASTATIPILDAGIVSRLPVVLPPMTEQQALLRSIDDQVRTLHSATAKAKREIDLIREYRTRLIADVVTGKVDVRHLAPPPGSEDREEMVDEPEPLDGAAGELDDEALAGEVAHAD